MGRIAAHDLRTGVRLDRAPVLLLSMAQSRQDVRKARIQHAARYPQTFPARDRLPNRRLLPTERHMRAAWVRRFHTGLRPSWTLPAQSAVLTFPYATTDQKVRVFRFF